jgi:hypothetical protein
MYYGSSLAEARSGQSRTSFHYWSNVERGWNTTVVETRHPAPADFADKRLVKASG